MKQARTLTEKEFKRALTAAAQHKTADRDRLILHLSFGCGLRACELAALNVSDVRDSTGKAVTEFVLKPTQTKGSQHHRVFVSTAVQRHIQLYLDKLTKHRTCDYPLFPSQRKTRRLSANTMTQLLCRTFAEAGLANATSHSGRRTFITNLANKAISIKVISTLARHSDVSVTSRYISVNDEQLRAAVEQM
jgi:integrase/recombinase XerD